MKTIWNVVKAKLVLAGLIVGAITIAISPLNLSWDNAASSDSTITIGNGRLVLTIGNPAYASGSLDYGTDGADDQVQFNQALAVLASHGGGELTLMTTNFSVSAPITFT